VLKIRHIAKPKNVGGYSNRLNELNFPIYMASKSAIAILEQKNTGETKLTYCYGSGTNWKGNPETISSIEQLLSRNYKINSVVASPPNDKGSIFITIIFETE
jgi:hypothetical protein